MYSECMLLFGEIWLRKDTRMINKTAVGQECESSGFRWDAVRNTYGL